MFYIINGILHLFSPNYVKCVVNGIIQIINVVIPIFQVLRLMA